MGFLRANGIQPLVVRAKQSLVRIRNSYGCAGLYGPGDLSAGKLKIVTRREAPRFLSTFSSDLARARSV